MAEKDRNVVRAEKEQKKAEKGVKQKKVSGTVLILFGLSKTFKRSIVFFLEERAMSNPMSRPTNDAPWAAAIEGQRVTATYSNAFRASGSAEELILDFGLDPHRRTGDDSEPTVLLQRLSLTWGQAKRLAVMLRDLVQLHEKNHGTIPHDNLNRPANPPSPPT